MWAEINGERKKVACGPCIRGHRSSKCDHRDRVLVEVRKPGRPLSSCPHPSGACSCERVVINYTIPKSSECACPSDQTHTSSSVAGNSNRVQKSRTKKATNSFTSASLEKAIKATHDAEPDHSSLLTRTPTNPSIAPSDHSTSNGASPPSSASSTPRIQPSSSRKQSYSSDFQTPDSLARPLTAHSQEGSSCCKPKPPYLEYVSTQPQKTRGNCCGGNSMEPPKPVPPKKSCCSGHSQPNQDTLFAQMSDSQNVSQNFGSYGQHQQQNQLKFTPHGSVDPGYNYLPGVSRQVPGNMGMGLPMGFNMPIYNHLASVYQQSPSMHMPRAEEHRSQVGRHGTEHNCHCGDSCSCFGCAAHPSNATMTEYIRLMHQYMSTGRFGALPPPTYDLPTYPHHPGYGAETPQQMQYIPQPTPVDFSGFQTTVSPMMNVPAPSVNVSAPWQQGSIQAPTHIPHIPPRNDHHFFSAAKEPQENLDLDTAPSPTFVDSPSDGKDDETSTLSPSSYLWQELVIPGCNDDTGTCQCGDGCECVGCLTHGGHNGVTLETTPTIQEDGFSQALTSPIVGGSGGNRDQFIPGAFTEAPT
ncbi:uncharacterized protein BDR25DRAFT_36614 [Lindgomyces ingoldianus]|uniref:Uncharacterized protein n=1 Tax=Lindgomyces ingoldianus TaxID=673940 RepID=A0ACB6QT74_9PLEO|nr:uncharacterized protein BDR25DRAFT_36614 [Lindgomyces ingoldianus]KAF2470085.1 hypothetical protein BDR25DRAFT_36614 [Lindgomyces ingoldianus]